MRGCAGTDAVATGWPADFGGVSIHGAVWAPALLASRPAIHSAAGRERVDGIMEDSCSALLCGRSPGDAIVKLSS